MLFKVDLHAKAATEVAHATLSALQLRERYDLQEWILATPRILGEDLLVITSEFSGFNRTAERLDVLALDKRGILVVVEHVNCAVVANVRRGHQLRPAATVCNRRAAPARNIRADSPA